MPLRITIKNWAIGDDEARANIFGLVEGSGQIALVDEHVIAPGGEVAVDLEPGQMILVDEHEGD